MPIKDITSGNRYNRRRNINRNRFERVVRTIKETKGRIRYMKKIYEKLTKDFLQAEDIQEINRINNIVRTMQNEI